MPRNTNLSDFLFADDIIQDAMMEAFSEIGREWKKSQGRPSDPLTHPTSGSFGAKSFLTSFVVASPSQAHISMTPVPKTRGKRKRDNTAAGAHARRHKKVLA